MWRCIYQPCFYPINDFIDQYFQSPRIACVKLFFIVPFDFILQCMLVYWKHWKRWEKICCILLFWHLLKIVTSVTVGFSFFLFFKLKKNSLLLNQGRLDKCTVQGYSLKKKIITATKRFYNQSVNSPTPNPIRNDWDKKKLERYATSCM